MDFGSGYSSFEYIDQLPLDKVKVDKSFVRRVGQSHAAREIIAGVVTLCRNLNLQCVLEGVETEGEMQILAPSRPEIIQGYLFGKPMEGVKASALLEKNTWERQYPDDSAGLI
jgi:EAL domain-containing protein (putative c-di-GMP-specific phosphodiesterase class I)